MRALIFGTFNPVTNAHVNMGIAARNKLGPSCEVIYIPTGDSYIRNWKKYGEGNIMPANRRILLLWNAVSPYGFGVSTIETDHVTDGKTYNAVKHFGFHNTVLCIGMDNIPKLKNWYKWKELLIRTRLLIFRRGTCPMTDQAKEILSWTLRYDFADLPKDDLDVSSTKVRELYRNKDWDTLKTIVPETTARYLEETEGVFT